jgi:hypothetical protein
MEERYAFLQEVILYSSGAIYHAQARFNLLAFMLLLLTVF